MFKKLPFLAGIGLSQSSYLTTSVFAQEPPKQHKQNQNLKESYPKNDNQINTQIPQLEGQVDPYKVMHIYDESLRSTNAIFKIQLQNLIQNSQKQENKAIWLKLTKDQLYLSQDAINQGFELHHAENNTLMLYKWLDQNKKNNLPEYCTHMIGCGGVIINDKNQILLVKEKNGYRKGTWNVPGGRVDTGESIVQGTIREVKEETNLDCTYEDVVLFREVQNTLFGKPDIYFAFLLKPQHYNVVIQKEELSDYKWVDIKLLESIIKDKNEEIKVIIPTQKAILKQILTFQNQNKQFYKDKQFTAKFSKFFNRPYNIFTPSL